ncbi:recombinase family protein [Bacillus sp. JJ722]|uniref:recombinase family protein n=1 Tax=Bacillus sp. JJ722 TaxID=3122973 RepID=UPI0030006AB6
MRTGLYKRVSTDMQVEEGVSLDNQESKLKAFCESQDWVIVKEYADEGISAKDIENRPGIQQMIKDIKNQKIDVVLVYKLDRLVRRVKDLHELLQVMDEYDVKFKSATEPFDTTTPAGRLFITMVAAIAEWERETIAERVYDNLKYRAEQGLVNGGPAPLGYDWEEGDLVVNQEEAKYVRYIFNAYLSKGMTSIAIDLNTKGVKTKNNNRFSQKAVERILKNPIYVGNVRWSSKSRKTGKLIKTPEQEIITPIGQENFEPIIDEKTFEQVQLLSKKRLKNNFKGDNDYLFSRLLVCNRCNTRLISHKKKRANGNYYRYYTCREKDHFKGCNLPSVSEVSVEKKFLELLTLGEFKIADTDNEDVHEDLQNELKKLLRKKDRIKELYFDGDIDKQEYTKRTQPILELEANIKNKLESKSVRTSKQEIIEMAEHVKEYWDVLSRDNKKKALQTIISSIKIEVLKSGNPNAKTTEERYSTIEITDIEFS